MKVNNNTSGEKKIVKRLITFRNENYGALARRLEKMAAKGLFLEKISSPFWHFRVDEPRDVQYTVTFFAEGSIYNPKPTENQENFYELAAAGGWDFVAEAAQMQIFMSNVENPVPFETDEQEKLNNIKKIMNKTYLPGQLVMLAVWLLNIGVQKMGYDVDPVQYLASVPRLSALALVSIATIYTLVNIFYCIWWQCASQKSIDNGGTCIEKTGKLLNIFTIIVLVVDTILILLMWWSFMDMGIGVFVLAILQLPIVGFGYWLVVQKMRKYNFSKNKNKVLSMVFLIFLTIIYMGLIVFVCFKSIDSSKEYTSVSDNDFGWEYKMYNDEIPLTCEELYINNANFNSEYEFYSYEARVEQSFLASYGEYYQNARWGDDAPELGLTVVQSKYPKILALAQTEFLDVEDWRDASWQEVAAVDFGAIEAYQGLYDGKIVAGKYVLIYENSVVKLNVGEPLNPDEMAIIGEKFAK